MISEKQYLCFLKNYIIMQIKNKIEGGENMEKGLIEHDENEKQIFIKPKDLVEDLGFINTGKVRNCTDEFAEYIHMKITDGGHRQYYKDAIPVLRRIKTLRQDEGLSVKEVKQQLNEEGFPVIRQHSEDEGFLDTPTRGVEYRLAQFIVKQLDQTYGKQQQEFYDTMRLVKEQMSESSELQRVEAEKQNQILKQQEELLQQQSGLLQKQSEEIQDLKNQLAEMSQKKRRWPWSKK